MAARLLHKRRPCLCSSWHACCQVLPCCSPYRLSLVFLGSQLHWTARRGHTGCEACDPVQRPSSAGSLPAPRPSTQCVAQVNAWR